MEEKEIEFLLHVRVETRKVSAGEKKNRFTQTKEKRRAQTRLPS